MHAVYIGGSFNSNLGQKLIIKPGKDSDTHEERRWLVGGDTGKGLILTRQKREGNNKQILIGGILSLGYSEAESHKALLLLCVSITQ